MSGNAERKYRLSDEVASSLDLPLNKSKRYRLDPFKEEIYLNHKPKRLFFDIETSPNIGYFWSAGWKLSIPAENIIQERKIICICYKWEGDDTAHSLTWNKKQCDKSMLKKFIKIADKADELVGHNGDKFDLAWIKTRALYHRIPVTKYSTLDTLKKSRGNFRFNSNRLDYIAKYLGVGGKTDTGGFSLWIRCMEGDPEALKDMVKYCVNDVIILEDVYNVMKNYYLPQTHHGVANGGDKWDCPDCGGAANHEKNRVTGAGTIKRGMRCRHCKAYYEISNKSYSNSLLINLT